jgi:hypothetical protein
MTGPDLGACTRLMVLLVLVPVLMLWKPQLYGKNCQEPVSERAVATVQLLKQQLP